jgi:hypothetical protein
VCALSFLESCCAWALARLQGLRRVDRTSPAGTGTESLQHGLPDGLPKAPLYHYCIIRADLPKGTQLAQTIHAAGESSPGNLPTDTRAIALAAKDEAQLLGLEAELRLAGIDFKAIREPDAPYLGALMAIGLAPAVRTPTLRRALGRLPLMR